MTTMRKALLAAGLVGSTFAGGAIGASLLGTANAQSTSTTTAQTPSSNSDAATPPGPGMQPDNGVFHPNEDAMHEKGESAAREAQEDAGQRPTQP